MSTSVDEYVADISDELRPIAETVRRIITDELPDADEAIKWSRPTYQVGSQHVCYVTAAKNHVTLGFTQGRSLTDPDGLLEGEGTQMAHIKLTRLDDVDEDQLRSWLRQARRLAEQA